MNDLLASVYSGYFNETSVSCYLDRFTNNWDISPTSAENDAIDEVYVSVGGTLSSVQ